MSGITRAASGGVVGGASSLSTAGSIAYVASAGVLGQDAMFARTGAGKWELYDSTPTTGLTTLTVRVGAGNTSGNDVFRVWNGSTKYFQVRGDGAVIFAGNINAANVVTTGGMYPTGASNAKISSGANSPEGVVAGNVGDVFLRTNGGASTTLYVKESGTGNTGWVGK